MELAILDLDVSTFRRLLFIYLPWEESTRIFTSGVVSLHARLSFSFGLCRCVGNPFLTNFEALYLSEFLTDLGQILDSKSYDQA